MPPSRRGGGEPSPSAAIASLRGPGSSAGAGPSRLPGRGSSSPPSACGRHSHPRLRARLSGPAPPAAGQGRGRGAAAPPRGGGTRSPPPPPACRRRCGDWVPGCCWQRLPTGPVPGMSGGGSRRRAGPSWHSTFSRFFSRSPPGDGAANRYAGHGGAAVPPARPGDTGEHGGRGAERDPGRVATLLGGGAAGGSERSPRGAAVPGRLLGQRRGGGESGELRSGLGARLTAAAGPAARAGLGQRCRAGTAAAGRRGGGARGLPGRCSEHPRPRQARRSPVEPPGSSAPRGQRPVARVAAPSSETESRAGR